MSHRPRTGVGADMVGTGGSGRASVPADCMDAVKSIRPMDFQGFFGKVVVGFEWKAEIERRG